MFEDAMTLEFLQEKSMSFHDGKGACTAVIGNFLSRQTNSDLTDKNRNPHRVEQMYFQKCLVPIRCKCEASRNRIMFRIEHRSRAPTPQGVAEFGALRTESVIDPWRLSLTFAFISPRIRAWLSRDGSAKCTTSSLTSCRRTVTRLRSKRSRRG